MVEGYIKLSRKLLDWRYFSKSDYLKVWIYILLRANHKKSNWMDIEINAGQFVTSVNKISEETNTSVQTVRTILKKLEGQEITSKTTNKYTLITILKWGDYQLSEDDSNKQSNKQLTNKQQTTNKQLTTNKNDKNDKNDKNIYNSLPVYDSSKNTVMSDEEANEILSLMKGQA